MQRGALPTKTRMHTGQAHAMMMMMMMTVWVAVVLLCRVQISHAWRAPQCSLSPASRRAQRVLIHINQITQSTPEQIPFETRAVLPAQQQLYAPSIPDQETPWYLDEPLLKVSLSRLICATTSSSSSSLSNLSNCFSYLHHRQISVCG